MKLLLISPVPPPIGGIASWSVNFLNYYSKNKNKWEIFHQNTAIKSRNITNNHLLARIFGGIRDTKRILTELQTNLKIIQPQVIHLTSSASLALFKDLMIVWVAKRKKISVVIHFRFGRIPQLAQIRNWEWHLLCRLIKQSSIIIVIDQKSFDTLKNLGFQNIENIPNPISNELEETLKLYSSTLVERKTGKVVFIGHVVPSKGIFELVEACVLIPQIKELYIIGPYEIEIKEKIMALAKKKNNGIWLFFTGTLGREEIFNQLRTTSLMVLPSYTEGFPNVVIEAMAMGCPIVATNVGAIPDMLDCESDYPCGICVKPHDINELKNAMVRLINNPEQAKSIGENGKKRVLEHYTFSNISQQYEKVWNKSLPN